MTRKEAQAERALEDEASPMKNEALTYHQANMLTNFSTQHLAEAITILMAINRKDPFSDERVLAAIHEVLLANSDLAEYPGIAYPAALAIIARDKKREDRIQRAIASSPCSKVSTIRHP